MRPVISDTLRHKTRLHQFKSAAALLEISVGPLLMLVTLLFKPDHSNVYESLLDGRLTGMTPDGFCKSPTTYIHFYLAS